MNSQTGIRRKAKIEISSDDRFHSTINNNILQGTLTESNATGLFARFKGVVFDHLQEFLHAVFFDFGFDDD